MSQNLSVFKKSMILGGILLAVFISFRPVLNNDFVNWDDDDYVLTNPLVKSLSPENINQIFYSAQQKIYSPLVILSFAVEYHFFGLNPFPYHLDNLILHLAIVALIFRFCLLLGFKIMPAAFASLLFGLHPMHVESVAWVTERKDVLYVFFYMLALNFYLQYINKPKGRTNFLLALFCGLLSMFCKPMALSLPFVFYLCDWFKGRKFDARCIAEKFFSFLYVIPIAWLTYSLYHYQYKTTLLDEVLKTIWIFIFYLQKFFWPMSLTMFYNLPAPTTILNLSYLFSVVILVLLLGSLILWREHKIFIFANSFYILSIFAGLRRVTEPSPGGLPYYGIDDRFMYLPSLGYCILIGFIFTKVFEHFKEQAFKRNLAAVVITLFFGFLSLTTFFQCQKWENSLVLWNAVIKQNPKAATAYNNRGVVQKDLSLALRDYTKCVELDPYFVEAYFNRALVYSKLGKFDAAIKDYTKCLELNPGDAEALRRRSQIAPPSTTSLP